MGGEPKTKRLAVSLSQKGAERLDMLADKHGVSRAAIIEALLECYPYAATAEDFFHIAHRLRYAAAEAQKTAAKERRKANASESR